MCEKRCEHPGILNGKEPGECSGVQIRECHGEEAVTKGQEDK
ncbi:MAG: hypothetical protein R6V14_04690 [Halanaerobiales bacterium]